VAPESGPASTPAPPWPQLAAERWNPALDDNAPGLAIDPGHRRGPSDLAAERTARADPYALAEREAIQAEGSASEAPPHAPKKSTAAELAAMLASRGFALRHAGPPPSPQGEG